MRSHRPSATSSFLVLTSVLMLAAMGLAGSRVAGREARPQAPAKPAVAASAAPAVGVGLGDFDAFVTGVMKEWKVPGAAVAVVQNGKVMLARGYGLRDVQANLPVTPATLFAIGSITKSFTVTLIGTLADEGKIEWDRPVRTYLPGFEMYDPVVTERLTVRDLVTHRSGLPRHDSLWYNSPLDREELVRRVRYLEPSKDLRTTYQYNNLMFLTAGYLAEQVTGTRWEDLVRRRILDPLGMTRSNFSVKASQQSSDFAKPYELAKDEVKEVPFRDIDQIGPAGSINSSAEEMARYLLMHLGRGKSADGRQIVSENNALQMQTPQMVTQGALRYPEVGHAAYGMAWIVSSYRGHVTVQHSGSIDGFVALATFLPREAIGVVVLTNLGAGQLTQVATYNVLDRLFGLDQVTWNRQFLDARAKQQTAAAEAKKRGVTIRREGTKPSHPLAEYAGEYEHPGYGMLRIGLDGDTLTMSYNRMSSRLQHFHYDIFEVPEDPLDRFEKMKISFFTALNGDIDSLSAPFEPSVKAIAFTRRADASMRQRAFLEPLTGQYDVGSQVVTIALRGEDTLVMTTSGQAERELIPLRGRLFDVKGQPGFSVEFRGDVPGAVREIVFHQPGGALLGRRK